CRPLGQVIGTVRLEAPRIQTSGDVVGQEVVAGEIKVDETRELPAEKEDVVGEKVGMDDPGRKPAWPAASNRLQIGLHFAGKALLDLVGPIPGHRPKLVATVD